MNWGWSTQRYEKSQKARLLELVAFLCKKLNRPVCSADLREYFKEYPEQRPLLFQRNGLILAKAHRKRCQEWPSLHKVGTLPKKSFYAPTDDPYWIFRFKSYALSERYRWFEKLEFVTTVLEMNNTDCQEKAVRAVSAFRLDWSEKVNQLDSDNLKDNLNKNLQKLDAIPSVKLELIEPEDMISRLEAERILKRWASRACGAAWAKRKNYRRILADWVWPQSSLYRERTDIVHSRYQIELLGSYLWNPKEGFRNRDYQLLLCSIYGV